MFWECSFPPFLHVRELPEFAYLMSLDRSTWPRCLLWHGWLPGLSSGGGRVLGLLLLVCWLVWRWSVAWVLFQWITLVIGLRLIIGMLTILLWKCRIILIFGVTVAGRIFPLLVILKVLVLVYIPAAEVAFESAVCCVAEEYGDARLERCLAFMPVPGVLQTVQRAEFWGAILALQAYWPCHLGIDNLNVARTTGRLLDRDCLVKPFATNYDLVALSQYMIRTRGRQTCAACGSVWECEADADLGVRHQAELIMDARRGLLKVRTDWYPILQQLHGFMVAVSRVAVNHDGKGVLPLMSGTMEEEGSFVGLVLWLIVIFRTAWFLGWAMDAGSRWLHHWC